MSESIESVAFRPTYTFNTVQNRCIYFYGRDNVIIGKFDFSHQSPPTFEGDVDDSVMVFVDEVIRLWGERFNGKV